MSCLKKRRHFVSASLSLHGRRCLHRLPVITAVTPLSPTGSLQVLPSSRHPSNGITTPRTKQKTDDDDDERRRLRGQIFTAGGWRGVANFSTGHAHFCICQTKKFRFTSVVDQRPGQSNHRINHVTPEGSTGAHFFLGTLN